MATRTREKGAARAENRDKRPQAHAKYIRLSSRKAKIVLDLIRGKGADEALAILEFTPKAASPVIYKVLSSAIANAVNNLKRYVARSRGSASPMLKRTCHISVVLDQKTK